MKSNIILLRTMLKSTSLVNIYRYTTDKKKKKKVVAGFIGIIILYAMLMGYSLSMCIGYGQLGIIDATPVMCAFIISAMSFLFTFFKTNGYLFNFKEYDMLMSLPFEARTVAGCKFAYMYIKSLGWYISISLAMLIGYGYYKRPSVLVYPVWIVMSLFIPVIPMLLASLVGFIIAKISAGFRKTNLIQTIFSFVFVIFCFSLRYIIDAVVKSDKVDDILKTVSVATDSAAQVYLPAAWFSGAVTKFVLSDMLQLVGFSILLFSCVFYVVGKSYRQINSALKSHVASKDYKMTAQKKHSVLNAIAFKEFKRMTGSTIYMTNGCMGEVLVVILGVVTLVVGFDKIVNVVTQGAPFDATIIQPAIPFVVYFMIGMVATTAFTPSLEGKNYWIMQSLPLENKTIYQGKMLFNMYLTVPFMSFGILCLSISAKVPVVNTIFYLVLGVALCAFSTTWGCVCGVKHMRLDWENEVEVIKQGASVAIYMFPNMFVVMGLVVLMVFLGMKMDHKVLTLIMTVIAAALSGLCYLRVMALSKRK
ncbi:MAG: hypothetical protein E7271_07975 [Lachnospiraceae bacterium]|nr:hypothetical protein [Lachnospiraceae bacterium]